MNVNKYKGLLQWTGVKGLHNEVIKYIRKYNEAESRILDLGAGNGAFSLFLKDQGYSIEAVEIEKERFKPTDIFCFNIDINQNIYEQINKRFDTIVSIEVLEHIENQRHFLRQCNKLLENKGKLIITTPNIESIPGRLRFFINGNFRHFDADPKFNEPTHINPIQSFMFNKAIAETGFNILTHNTFPSDTFVNSKIVTFLLSSLLARFLKGYVYGEVHIFVLEKISA